MFFASFDRDPSATLRRPWRPLGRGAAALALAAATAAPVVVLPALSRANSAAELEEALVLLADQAKPTDAELLARGIEEFSKGQYETAQITLQQVKVDALGEAERAKLTDILRKVESAVAERQAARAAFEKGEAALADKKYSEAAQLYQAAAGNKFADAATRSKAESQLAIVQASQKDTKQDSKALYKEAQADFKAGRLDAAKAKFEQLQAAGYKGGLLDRRPESFLKEINRKLSAPAQAVAQDKAPAQAEPTPAAVSPDKQAAPAADASAEPAQLSPKQAYESGVAEYKRGDYAAARVHFTQANDAKYKPGLFKDSPSRYLQMIDARESKAAQVAAAAQAAPATKATPAAEASAAPATAPAASPQEVALRETADAAKMKQQQQAFEAQQLVEKAKEAQKDNRLRDAYVFYRDARRLDPNNREAAEGEVQMERLVVGVGGTDGGLMDSEIKRIKIVKDAITYSFDKAIVDTETAVKNRDFTASQEALSRAKVARDSAPQYFSRDELARFDATLNKTQLDASRVQGETSAQQSRNTADQALRNMQDRERSIQEEKRRTVATLVRNAKQLVYEGNYTQAQAVINQILAIDPTNDYAVGVKQFVQDYAVLQEQRRFRERADREMQAQLNRTEESKIPYTDVLNYPSNWPDIAEMRDREVAAEKSGGAQDLQVQALLDKRLPEIRFENQGFADVVDFMRDVTGANIFVNWRAMEAAGVEKTSQISARLRDVKFSKALTTVLADVGGGSVKLGYTVDDGVITISTADDLNKNTLIHVYDIRDLLVLAPDPNSLNFDMGGSYGGNSNGGSRGGSYGNSRGSSSGSRGSYGGSGGGSGGGSRGGTYGSGSSGGYGSSSSYGGNSSNGNGYGGYDPARAEELVQSIGDLIKESVDPDSWSDKGGKGSLKPLSGQFIITQTPENHRQIMSLLDKLRETRAIQVSVEARFLTVQRNFLEDIGVDLDFFFNINNPNNFSPISVQQNSSTFTQTPATPAPGSLGSTVQPAMQIQGSFLDDYQVNFLIRATQANQNSTILTAPRVTVFNAQTAVISVTTDQFYVADLDPVVSQGAAIFDPIPEIVQSGVILQVTPTVSADRKYVTLSLVPTLQQLIDLATFPVSGTSVADTGGEDSELTQIATGNIQLPLIQVTQVATLVSVPDGGTLLLGGQTIAGEIEVEEGVPVLSKIPFLKRLFTNKSTAKDEQILLILVKPQIIIQREIEQQQFPMLGSKR